MKETTIYSTKTEQSNTHIQSIQQSIQHSTQHTHSFTNGAIAGMVEVLFTHPIDVYKTQLQNKLANKHVYTPHQNNVLSSGSIHVYRHLKMYYNGFGARLCAIVPMRLTFWGMQDVSNNALQNYTSWKPVTIGVSSGIIAGCAQTLVDAPTEWLKIQRITNPSYRSMHYWTAITSLLRKQYIPGFLPTLYRNIIVVCCLNTGMLCYGHISKHPHTEKHEHVRKQQFAVSAISSLFGSFISHPFDVVKTSMQRANTPPLSMSAWFKMYFTKHPLSLWTGVFPRCTQVMLSMGIGSVVFYGLK